MELPPDVSSTLKANFGGFRPPGSANGPQARRHGPCAAFAPRRSIRSFEIDRRRLHLADVGERRSAAACSTSDGARALTRLAFSSIPTAARRTRKRRRSEAMNQSLRDIGRGEPSIGKCAYDAFFVAASSAVLCSLCAVAPPHAAEAADGRRRAQAAGRRGHAHARGRRRLPRRPTTTRGEVKRLTGARKVELGGVVKRPRGDGGARPVHGPRRVPALFLTLQRNVECWSTAAAAALRRARRLHRLRARLPVLSRPRHPDPVARDVRQAQRLLERRQALRRARGRAAGREQGRSPPSAPAASRGSTCSRSTARRRRGSARSPRAPACRRWRARPRACNRQADVFPVALRGLGIFQTAPPPGVRIAPATARTTCSTPACRG